MALPCGGAPSGSPRWRPGRQRPWRGGPAAEAGPGASCTTPGVGASRGEGGQAPRYRGSCAIVARRRHRCANSSSSRLGSLRPTSGRSREEGEDDRREVALPCCSRRRLLLRPPRAMSGRRILISKMSCARGGRAIARPVRKRARLRIEAVSCAFAVSMSWTRKGPPVWGSH